MLLFSLLILFRALAGWQNGLGYAGKIKASFFLYVLLAVLCAGGAAWLGVVQKASWISFVACLLFALSFISALAIHRIFIGEFKGNYADIHFWEIFKTGGVTLAALAINSDLIPIALSVYPGLLLHKAGVNLPLGLGFFYHGTDDATGATFSIPLLGWKVKRLSKRGRIIIAAASVAGMVAAHFLNIHLRLW